MVTTALAEHSAHGHATKRCDCGCDSKPDCCELECLVQPRFFCGQLLADQDLTALVDWVKAKSGLSRFRHGWGIVCGLDVHCGRNGTVRVSPGYALDCCGRDVVVCEETTFDLTGCWQRPEDPCGNGSLERARNQRVFSNGAAVSTASFGELEIPPEQIQAVDLYIRYSESATDARTALARGGCGGAAGCEYTRVEEGYELYCKPAPDCLDPNEAIVDAWDEEYYNGLRDLFDAFEIMFGLDSARRHDRLLAWLNEQPLQTFCYVREWLCDLRGEENGELTDELFLDAVFLIAQDYRNAYFRALCKGCGPDTGIRLARVWLWNRRVENREKFSTLYVDAYLPFRRLLERDDYPAPEGYVNLAPLVWQPVDHAAVKLHDLGFTDIFPQEFAFPDLIALRSALLRRNSMFIQLTAGSPTRIFVYYYTDHCGRRRVVGFSTPMILFEEQDTDSQPPENPSTGGATRGEPATGGPANTTPILGPPPTREPVTPAGNTPPPAPPVNNPSPAPVTPPVTPLDNAAGAAIPAEPDQPELPEATRAATARAMRAARRDRPAVPNTPANNAPSNATVQPAEVTAPPAPPTRRRTRSRG